MATKNDYADELYGLVATGKINSDDAAIKLDESGVEVTDEVYDNFRQAEKDYQKSQRSLEVGDIVTIKGKNGVPNFEGNFRGITSDGKYIVVGKNGYQNSYDKSDIIVGQSIVKSTEKKESSMSNENAKPFVGEVWDNKLYNVTYNSSLSDDIEIARKKVENFDGCKVEIEFYQKGYLGGTARGKKIGEIRAEYTRSVFPNFVTNNKDIMFFEGKRRNKYVGLNLIDYENGNPVVVNIKVLKINTIDRSYPSKYLFSAIEGIDKVINKMKNCEYKNHYDSYLDFQKEIENYSLKIMNGNNEDDKKELLFNLELYRKNENSYNTYCGAKRGDYYNKIVSGQMELDKVLEILKRENIEVPQNILDLSLNKSTEKKESTMAKKELVVSNSGFKVISVEDSLKKYTPELSDNDIKGFVWYNRTLGIPMTGFEKWFMPNTSKNVVKAKSDVDFLNQQYQIVGKFQEGDEVGKVTRFENEYAGTTYVAVRRFDNSLCLVDKSQLSINNKYEVSTKDLDELVKTQSLMYLNEMYLPLHVYTNTDYDTLKSSLLNDKQHIISKYGQDVYDYHESVLSGYVTMRVDHPIKDKRYILNPYGEIARETKTIPPTETDEVSISDYFEDYIFTLNNSDFKLVSKLVYVSRIIRQEKNTDGVSSQSTEEEKRRAIEQRNKEISDAILERDRLFSDFVTNTLDGNTVKVLNKKINETYNRSVIINTSKVPVGFKHSNKLKTNDFALKPVQVDAFKFAISRNNYCLALNVGYGKGHLLTSNLISPQGHIKMSDVKIGNEVIGKNGLPTKIIGIFPLGKVQCYKVTFSDGTFSEVSDEHLWNVQTFQERNKATKYYGKWRTIETKSLIKDIVNKRGDCKYSIPMTSPVEFDKKEVPIHPYVLGVLLGDGNLDDNGISLSNTEKDILDKVTKLLPNTLKLSGGYNNGTDWSITNIEKSRKNILLDTIRDLKLADTKSNSKFIPDIYKINSYEVRLEVLRGLLDTDGYITNPSKIKERNGNSIIYTTVSKRLCDDVVFLVQSFGGTCIVKEKTPHYTYKDEYKEGQLAYDVTIRLSNEIIPVSSEKQLAKYKPKTKYQPIRFIESIEDIGFQEAQCIKVDALDELYLCENFVVTHNTSVQISIFSYLMGTGTINKPLMIVPKPVLKNWQKELFGFWSSGNVTSFVEQEGWTRNYGILTDCGFDFYNIKNLSKSIVKDSKKIKEVKKGIILGAYEALEKMYISDDDTRMFIIQRWKEILDQKDESSQTDRESTLKVTNLISKLNEVDKDAEIDIMDIGFDSIYFDEAHRLKNLFVKVTADKTNRVRSGFVGVPSSRSLRAFYITQYLLKIKGHIGFLTATPFSNSPLEVYTMLVFLNYPELAKNNVNVIRSFVEQFFNETLEYIVDNSGKIVSKSVMKSYKNKPILFKMLSNTFIYRQDPILAGIKRPCLITYPNKNVKLIIKQSPLQILQRDIMVGKTVDYDEYLINYPEIEPYLEDFKAKWADIQNTPANKGMGGKILSASKSSAFSPFAQSPLMLDFVTIEPWRELYEFSPKIRFTIDSIKNMIDYQKQKGDKLSSYLIYVGVGVNILPQFKEALNKICGFKSNLNVVSDEDDDDGKGSKMKITYDEVEIIEGTADTNKEENRRDRVGDLFNDGKVKVIIGTDTIKEGLNLQVNCATLFILTPTWNSTDIKQIEGRIHRQGNKYGYARAITPLVTRTLDSFIYQKYEEKEGRINDLWGNNELSTTSSLDVQISPSKQKELILDDAVEIAKIRVELIELNEINEYNKIEDEFNSLKNAIKLSTKYKFYVDFFSQRLPKINEQAQKNLSGFKVLLNSIDKNSESYLKSKKDRIETIIRYYEELDVTIKKAISSNEIIDLINIFTGDFKRRNYQINVDYYDMDSFKRTCAKLNIDYVGLLAEQTFESVGILTSRDKNYWEKDEVEDIYELIKIYAKCAAVEKFILNPEGLSLTSNPDELNEKVLSYAQRVDDKVISMEVNFEVVKSVNGIKLTAKPECLTKIADEARIELDEENKLTQKGDQLANYFADKTNIQLDYKINDVDTSKCNVPYSDVNVDKIISNAQIIKPEPITIIPEPIIEPITMPKKEKPTPAPLVVTKNKGVQKLNTVGDEFFAENPDKILGEMSISDFRNMIMVKGTKNDVISYFKELFSKPIETKPFFKTEPTQIEPKKVEPTQVEPTQPEPTVEDIKRLIKSLQILADMGDIDAKTFIRSLKLLV